MAKLDKIDPADRKRIDTCLGLAFGRGSDAEVLAGLKSAKRVCEKNNITLAEYFVSSKADGQNIESLSVNLSRTEELETKVDRLEQQLIEARDQTRSLERQLAEKPKPVLVEAKPIHSAVDGFFTYDAFYSALLSHLGTPKRALSVFSEVTEYSPGKIQSWRRANKVPEAAFAVIETLDRSNVTFSNHQKLTEEHKRRIDVLAIAGKGDQEIADVMNSEFGDRVFNVNMIKGAKTQIRASFLEDLKFDGKTRDEAKELFLKRYPNARTIDRLLDKHF